MLENLFLVVGLIAVGSVMRRSSLFPESTADVLNTFVLNVSLPAIIVVSISKLTISSEVMYPILSHWAIFPIHIGLVYLVYKWFKFSKEILGILLIVTTMGNTAFLGIPLSKTFFGADSIPYAVLYDQLGTGIAFILIAAFVVPMFSSEEKKDLKTILFDMLKFPPFVGLILGFLFIALPLPSLVENLLNQIAATLIPCAMIAVGFQMKYKMKLDQLIPLGVGLWLKLILIPLIVLFSMKFIGANHTSAQVSILQAGMPPIVTGGALAMNIGLNRDLCAAFVGYGLIISFGTLLILQMFI